jgi:hypothetical protein
MINTVNTLRRLQELQAEMDKLGITLREADQPAPPATDQAANGQQAQGTAQQTAQQQQADGGGADVQQIVSAIEAAIQKSIEPLTKKLDEIGQSLGNKQEGGNNGEQKPAEQKPADNNQQQSTDKSNTNTDNKTTTAPADNNNKQQESLFREIYNTKLT